MNSIIYLSQKSMGWVLLVGLALMAGCRDNQVSGPGEQPSTPNLLQTIQSDPGLTILEELLEGTSLQTVLNENGTTTIFAPTDAAFNNLPVGYLESLDIDQKRQLLEYHAYQGNYRIQNEIKKESLITIQGDPLFVELGQSFGDLINNQARFITTNRVTQNGVLQTIDKVLVPDQLGTLYDNIYKRYEFKNFAARLEAADLAQILQAPGTKTLLTTSDVALGWYETGEGLSFTDEEWREIMQYHILATDFTVTGPGTRMALPTMHQDSVYLVVDQVGEFLINGEGGSPVQQIFSTNGKIVLPSGIMLPDKFLGVLPIMDKRYSYKTFRAALASARMTGRLYNGDNNANEKFTLFVPADNAQGINSLPTDENELAELLKYHILLDQLDADELQDGQSYTSWQGKQITITKTGNKIMVNGIAAVKQPQMMGKNGVVFVIDRVLELPSN